ncbi:MAG: DUF5798 family protein [Halobacteriales archaeon]|nr:DUF5798 family protein [Halobacteriales archaeon]
MVLGNATQKIQTLVELAEELYEKVMEIRQQLVTLKETAGETNERVARLEQEVAEQRAILEALAEREDIDIDATVGDIEIDPVTTADDTESDGSTDEGTATAE